LNLQPVSVIFFSLYYVSTVAGISDRIWAGLTI
jgi:hypothetical protein